MIDLAIYVHLPENCWSLESLPDGGSVTFGGSQECNIGVHFVSNPASVCGTTPSRWRCRRSCTGGFAAAAQLLRISRSKVDTLARRTRKPHRHPLDEALNAHHEPGRGEHRSCRSNWT